MMAADLPVGIILCPERIEALARYALEGLPNRMLVSEYRALLPDEQSRCRERTHPHPPPARSPPHHR